MWRETHANFIILSTPSFRFIMQFSSFSSLFLEEYIFYILIPNWLSYLV